MACGLDLEGLLLQNRLGQILRYKDASVTFRKVARKIGMKEGEGMHVLCHTLIYVGKCKNNHGQNMKFTLI